MYELFNNDPQGWILLSRLFPFGRGLMHAYWAPNVWALYTFVDKIISIIQGKDGGGLTRGNVGEAHTYKVLPGVTPLRALLLTVYALSPLSYSVLKKPTTFARRHAGSNKTTNDNSDGEAGIVEAIVISGFCFFLFGWHVHEKAILMVTVPLGLIAADNANYRRFSFFLSTVGHYSLFPLLFTPTEYPIKVLFFVLHTLLQSIFFHPQLAVLEKLYLWGIVPLEIFASFLHPFYLQPKLPFLPLLVISVYCSVGVVYSFGCLYYTLFIGRKIKKSHEQ